MANHLERAAALRNFDERLAGIAAEHRTLEKQRRAVAELIREMNLIGNPTVIADLLEGKKIRTDLKSNDQNMWVAHELFRLDGLGYEEAVNKVAEDFHKSPKTVEAAVSKAKKAGRSIL